MSGPCHTGRQLVRLGHILMIRRFNFHINHLSFLFCPTSIPPKENFRYPLHNFFLAGPVRIAKCQLEPELLQRQGTRYDERDLR
jgi:hypothetical protein